MSLWRQLLTLLCGILCLACVLTTGFLTARRFLIVPTDHPLAQHTPQKADIPQLESLLLPTKVQPVPIIPTPVVNNDWQVSSQAVSWLQTEDAQRGKILYGHNWANLLGSLHETEVGQILQLRYSDLTQEAYVVQDRFTVAPTQLDVLKLAQDPDTLLVYTCSGWLDRVRLVVIAKKIELTAQL